MEQKNNPIEEKRYNKQKTREELERENRRNQEKNQLTLIPKSTQYVQYILDMLLKLPRTEKYSIGTEYKTSMYQMIENIMYLTKIDMEERFSIINKIDAELSTQRIFLRIMVKNRWIDEHKEKVAMNLIYEMGKIIGGLVKYYGKNYKKSI